jgi:enoyl-CoA hydratase/carnithine racemase
VTDVCDGIGETREGQTLVLTFTNPERRNAFTPAMRRRAARLLDASYLDETVRAIIIRGEGAHFCAGADLTAVESGERTQIQFVERMREAHTLVRTIAHGPKPVIAAVEGSAFGAGLSIAAACDLVVAAEDARFGMAFTSLGLAPDFGLLATLPQRVGRQAARRMIYLSEKVGGAEALELGLVDKLAPPGGALETALALAAALASAAPLAFAAAKRALAGRMETIEEALRAELDLLPGLAGSSDFREGVAAFKDKRPPKFTGR